MKIKTTFFVLILIFCISFFGKAQEVLDQSQTNYNSGTSARNLPGYSHWQSFNAGITGTLTKIELGFFNAISGVGTLNIYDGAGTAGTLLQTQTVSVVCASGGCLIPFVVSAPVTSGQVYTFHFTPGTGIPDPYGVQMEVPGTYAAGQMALVDPSGTYLPGFDHVFKTYVTAAVTGISANIALSAIQLYPNPATDVLRLTIPAAITKAEVSVYNMLGEIVVSENSISSSVSLDVSNLRSGVYFVEVVSEKERVVKKFVKE